MKRLGIFFYIIFRSFLAFLLREWRRADLIGRGVKMAPTARLIVDEGGKFCAGPRVAIGSGSLLIAVGNKFYGNSAKLSIEQDVAINEYCNIRAAGGDISIGSKTMLAQFVTIIGSNHGIKLGEAMVDQPWDNVKIGVEIGSDVWLGANVVVLPGVRIGNGAVVAAGAVVNTDIPPQEIWGGVPARRISNRRPG